MASSHKVCYYGVNFSRFDYGEEHAMKPYRINMTHDLIRYYGLHEKMELLPPRKATAEEMMQYHDKDYIRLLQSITPDNMSEFQEEMEQYKIGTPDCPVFDGLFKFCQLSAGGSLSAAKKLNEGTADIAVNWTGGLHHAKQNEASGFCYVNDIVLAILELRKRHKRVLYIDIDVHHGDGVERAFESTDRVMTLSFHKYGKFFPDTGHLLDVGKGEGMYYSVNVPLKDGIDDASYESIFKPVVERVMETYRPSVVVMQCGADSLTGDLLGPFNLTVRGHAKCVGFVKQFNLPLLLLGGGGYTVENVARCWAYETVVALEMEEELPLNGWFNFVRPDCYQFYERPENQNTPRYLNMVKRKIFENLRRVENGPSAPLRYGSEDGMTSSDERVTKKTTEKRVIECIDLTISDDEEDRSRDQRSSCKKKRVCKQPDPGNTAITTYHGSVEVDGDDGALITDDLKGAIGKIRVEDCRIM